MMKRSLPAVNGLAVTFRSIGAAPSPDPIRIHGAEQALTLSPGLAQGLDVGGQNAQAVSRGLFAQYLLPFEILSVILLVALVGAVVLAKSERR